MTIHVQVCSFREGTFFTIFSLLSFVKTLTCFGRHLWFLISENKPLNFADNHTRISPTTYKWSHVDSERMFDILDNPMVSAWHLRQSEKKDSWHLRRSDEIIWPNRWLELKYQCSGCQSSIYVKLNFVCLYLVQWFLRKVYITERRRNT